MKKILIIFTLINILSIFYLIQVDAYTSTPTPTRIPMYTSQPTPTPQPPYLTIWKGTADIRGTIYDAWKAPWSTPNPQIATSEQIQLFINDYLQPNEEIFVCHYKSTGICNMFYGQEKNIGGVNIAGNSTAWLYMPYLGKRLNYTGTTSNSAGFIDAGVDSYIKIVYNSFTPEATPSPTPMSHYYIIDEAGLFTPDEEQQLLYLESYYEQNLEKQFFIHTFNGDMPGNGEPWPFISDGETKSPSGLGSLNLWVNKVEVDEGYKLYFMLSFSSLFRDTYYDMDMLRLFNTWKLNFQNFEKFNGTSLKKFLATEYNKYFLLSSQFDDFHDINDIYRSQPWPPVPWNSRYDMPYEDKPLENLTLAYGKLPTIEQAESKIWDYDYNIINHDGMKDFYGAAYHESIKNYGSYEVGPEQWEISKWYLQAWESTVNYTSTTPRPTWTATPSTTPGTLPIETPFPMTPQPGDNDDGSFIKDLPSQFTDKLPIAPLEEVLRKIEEIQVAKPSPPVFKINIHSLAEPFKGIGSGFDNSFDDEDVAWLDFAKLEEVQFMGSSVIDWFRTLISALFIWLTVQGLWRRITSNEVVPGG